MSIPKTLPSLPVSFNLFPYAKTLPINDDDGDETNSAENDGDEVMVNECPLRSDPLYSPLQNNTEINIEIRNKYSDKNEGL